jgi:hypothetical protein
MSENEPALSTFPILERPRTIVKASRESLDPQLDVLESEDAQDRHVRERKLMRKASFSFSFFF